MILSHLTKALIENPLFDLASRQALMAYYKDEAIIGKLGDKALIDMLSELFMLKPITIDELQPLTYRFEMLKGPCKPDVYTMLWELGEDDRAKLFYDHRRRNISGTRLEDNEKIVLFHCPVHPLDGEIPLSHFTSNDELFNCFVNYYRGVNLHNISDNDSEAGIYFSYIQGMDLELTMQFGFGKEIKLIDTPVYDERIADDHE